MIAAQRIGEAKIVEHIRFARADRQSRFIGNNRIAVSLLLIVNEPEQVVRNPTRRIQSDGFVESCLGFT